MAESPLDRLKRLAAEKKLAAAQPVVSVQAETASAEGGASVAVVETVAVETSVNKLPVPLEVASNEQARVRHELPVEESIGSGEVLESEPAASAGQVALQPLQTEAGSDLVSNAEFVAAGNISTHPLAMQFAELEAALLAQQPEFKTILRQIHRHLGQEPELVTQMTEQEIQLIVSGLVVFANAEIVAPAVAKTAKAKIAAAKKVPISADDL